MSKKVTVTVVARHRGDGRAIYQEIEVDWKDAMRENLKQVTPVQWRAMGKSLALGMMYGAGKQMSWNQANRMFEFNGGKVPRDPANGPFKVVLDPRKKWVRRSRRHGGMKEPGYKVVNKNGWRVHRGSKASCDSVCDNLNVEHVKWIMTKPDSSQSVFMDLESWQRTDLYQQVARRFGRFNP